MDAGTGRLAEVNPCTDDICNASGRCTHPTNSAPCNDNVFCDSDRSETCNDDDPCTSNDKCATGICVGTPGQCGRTTTLTDGPLCGDAKDDGKISAPDALLALKAGVGTEECSLEVCDYNGDGSLAAGDALRILEVGLGQMMTPKCPQGLLATSPQEAAVSSTTTTTID